MSFLVIINNDYATCSSDNLMLSNKDVLKLSSADNVLEYIRSIKTNEESNIKKSVQDGYEAGYKDGLKQAEKKLNDQFKAYLNEITDSIYTNRIETDQEIIELACEVTKKIASDIGPKEMLSSLAATAIQNLNNKGNLQIKVNPAHAQELQTKLDLFFKDGTGDELRIEILPDKNLGDLDIVIKTQVGETIASFDDQLRLLKNNLMDNLSS